MDKNKELDGFDIANIRRIIDELDMSIASANMDIITFNAEVARIFNSLNP